MTLYTTEGPAFVEGYNTVVLQDYVEHKNKLGPAVRQTDPLRYTMAETEALRDLVVMDRITGSRTLVVLDPVTLDNPECARLIAEFCTKASL